MSILTFFGSSLDRFDFILLGFVLFPILFAIIMAKSFNIFHGLISYLFASFLVVYFIEANFFGLTDKILPGYGDASNLIYFTGYIVKLICKSLTLIPNTSILTQSYANHLFLVIFVLLYATSQFIATALKSRKRR